MSQTLACARSIFLTTTPVVAYPSVRSRDQAGSATRNRSLERDPRPHHVLASVSLQRQRGCTLA